MNNKTKSEDMKTLDEKIINDTASNEEVVQYLVKEGLDPEKLLREGSTFMKLLNEKLDIENRYNDLSGALRFKVGELEKMSSDKTEWQNEFIDMQKKAEVLKEENERLKGLSECLDAEKETRIKLESDLLKAKGLMRKMYLNEGVKIDPEIEEFIKGEQTKKTEENKLPIYATINPDTKWIYAGHRLKVKGVHLQSNRFRPEDGREFELCLIGTEFEETHGYKYTYIYEKDLILEFDNQPEESKEDNRSKEEVWKEWEK